MKALVLVLFLFSFDSFARDSEWVGRSVIFNDGGKEMVATVGTNPGADGQVIVSWIERDTKCRFGILCNNKGRTRKFPISNTSIFSVPQKDMIIGGRKRTVREGMLVSTTNGAIMRVDSVFPNGKVSVTQMEADPGKRYRKPPHIGLRESNGGLSGILSSRDIAGVETSCYREAFCKGSFIEFKSDLDKPICTKAEANDESFNAPKDKNCKDIIEIILAFSDGTHVGNILSKTGGYLPVIRDRKLIAPEGIYAVAPNTGQDAATMERVRIAN